MNNKIKILSNLSVILVLDLLILFIIYSVHKAGVGNGQAVLIAGLAIVAGLPFVFKTSDLIKKELNNRNVDCDENDEYYIEEEEEEEEEDYFN